MCLRCRQKRDHWLEKADDKYPSEFINEVKTALHVMILFIPIPFFWALYDQQVKCGLVLQMSDTNFKKNSFQGSRWTFQAIRMDGQLGEVYKIKPDQMQILTPIFILAFVPLFDFGLYPLLAKCHLLRKPLQRMATGGFLAAFSFFLSAILESQLEVMTIIGEGRSRTLSDTSGRVLQLPSTLRPNFMVKIIFCLIYSSLMLFYRKQEKDSFDFITRYPAI